MDKVFTHYSSLIPFQAISSIRDFRPVLRALQFLGARISCKNHNGFFQRKCNILVRVISIHLADFYSIHGLHSSQLPRRLVFIIIYHLGMQQCRLVINGKNEVYQKNFIKLPLSPTLYNTIIIRNVNKLNNN